MNTYTIRGNYPAACECSAEVRWTDVEAETSEQAIKQAREHFAESIRITIVGMDEDKSDPCPFCGKPFKTCGHF